VSGVLTAFLSGIGRPGLGSAAMGLGLVVTILLDLALIPDFGIVGAATASTVAYLSSAAILMLSFRAATRHADQGVGPVAIPRTLEVPR
jgi:O-antigen/teichoic acid export membrane protein